MQVGQLRDCLAAKYTARHPSEQQRAQPQAEHQRYTSLIYDQYPPHVKDRRFDYRTTRSISEPGGSILERPVRFRNRAVRFRNALTLSQCPAKRTTSPRTELTEENTDCLFKPRLLRLIQLPIAIWRIRNELLGVYYRGTIFKAELLSYRLPLIMQ